MVESVSTTLLWPWTLGIIAALAVAIVIVVGARSSRRRARAERGSGEVRWVANSARIARLRALGSAIRRYRVWQWAGVGTVVIALVGVSVVAARPATVEVKQSTLGTRDIVLCLDISGSMLEFDRQVVDVFGTLVDSFSGERIALSIFNETSRTVFPLTNDYDLVKEQLDIAYDALDPAVVEYASNAAIDRYLDFVTGTTLTGTQSSLIGDGLANCALLFDDSGGTERSRSIIFATDNDLRGEPVYPLDDALALARERRIEVSGLYGASSSVYDPNVERNFEQSITEAGGYFYRVNDAAAVRGIVDRVQEQQAVDLEAAPEVTQTESPGRWLLLALLALAAALVVQGRLRE
ncbi:VWA domain-containing protein [Rarobacter faecitabidus]|uniref:Ca-activated chloride channel family protein n=1 Tax=Rarobacter faecitabidus TaxID=13243 RepID=A0A542ZP09_RARFA|nr:VWA domain-containing protein [Rarobacter faecitabidus]TQL62092.1 Ca-activated chloride channel family protein [Rarobacter faecitabidus]